MRRRVRIGALALAGVFALAPRDVGAHGLRPGVLTLLARPDGTYAVSWTAPVDTRADAAKVDVRWPDDCTFDAPTLRCDGAPTQVELAGLTAQGGRVLVSITDVDGNVTEHLVTASEPTLRLDASPGRSAWAWISLGARHILGGLDHLAFLAGLLLVVSVSGLRRLVATITAFTVAHSVTLLLAATGVLALHAAPVEATIAASVVLVAREALDARETWTRRFPWLVAGLFGLVHGLGFAGALSQWGLPPGWVGRSLLWFNVGVELGQLAVVVPVVLLARWLGPRLRPLHPVAAYAIGGLGMWWLLDRTLAIVTAPS